jgi:Tfp pilus assembly protein PilN
MRPVNLIPPEDRRGDRAPMRTGPLAYVVVGFLVLVLGGVYMLVSSGNAISEREAEAAGLEQQLAETQARASALQSFTSFASVEQARAETISSLARSRFDWERVMRELALVIPADVTLDSLTGSVGAAGSEGSSGSDTGSSAGIEAPSLQMSGCGEGHASVARLVAALRDIDGVTRVGLSSSQEADAPVAGAAPAPTGGGTGSCSAGGATFELVVAFDGVEVDPGGAGIVPQTPPAEGDSSAGGVGAAVEDRKAARDSVGAAESKAREVANRYVPGA